MDGGLLSLKWNNHKTTFFHVLSNIRKKEAYCDATLACDGRFYPVHKLVLSTCSDYFEQMFEKTKDKQPVIVLKDIRHEDLEALLNYMYLGEVNVLQNDLSGLIKAAECLRIKGLAVPDEDPCEKKDNINKRSWDGDSQSDGKRQRRDDRERQEERREEKRREERREERRQEYSSSHKAQEYSSSHKTPDYSSSHKTPDYSSSHKTPDYSSTHKTPDYSSTHKTPEYSSTHKTPEYSSSHKTQEYSSSHKESSREPSRTDIGVASSPSQSLSASRSPEPEPSRTSSSHNSNTSNDVPEQAVAAAPMVVLDEEQPVVKEEPSEGYSIEDTGYTDGSVDNKEELQASFEAPNLVQDIATSLGYDQHQQSLRAGQPQSMEDLVAQVMPGSSGMQGKAWEGSNQSLIGLGYNEIENYSEDGQQRTAPMGQTSIEGGEPMDLQKLFLSELSLQLDKSGGSFDTTTPPSHGPKMHECQYCGKNFNNIAHLRRHVRIHTGEKPFACPYCSYRAAVKGNLNQHIRTHTGEKPYSCTFCAYQTANKCDLTRHVRLHTATAEELIQTPPHPPII